MHLSPFSAHFIKKKNGTGARNHFVLLNYDSVVPAVVGGHALCKEGGETGKKNVFLCVLPDLFLYVIKTAANVSDATEVLST